MGLSLHLFDLAGLIVAVYRNKSDWVDVGSFLQSRSALTVLGQVGCGVALHYFRDSHTTGILGVPQKRLPSCRFQMCACPDIMFGCKGDLAEGGILFSGEVAGDRLLD